MRAADSPLRLATQELHHAAERHPLGAAMADGSISGAWWADWICALQTVHRALDLHLPPELERTESLNADAMMMLVGGYTLNTSPEAEQFAARLMQGHGITGAAYVFTGAHLMGGAVTERALQGRLPAAHLRWLDRGAAIIAWQPYRSDPAAADDARAAFRCVFNVLDEILARHPIDQ